LSAALESNVAVGVEISTICVPEEGAHADIYDLRWFQQIVINSSVYLGLRAVIDAAKSTANRRFRA